ncbi:MAG: hypothetical protein DMF92_11325 [Acidobacteria bacterium]|nr:MAG: hypothetical protein DMF92_11325 [Acidobacteriota bacterium]
MRPAIAVLVGIVVLGVIAVSLSAGQFGGGRRSPHESVSAKIDGATMTIEYGRPYMRGRTIFGGLVPYQIVWCPGADAATTLDSTRPLQLGGLAVPPGPHTIWILPTPDVWTLIVRVPHVLPLEVGPRAPSAAQAYADGTGRAADVRDREEPRRQQRRLDRDDVGDDRSVGPLHRCAIG